MSIASILAGYTSSIFQLHPHASSQHSGQLLRQSISSTVRSPELCGVQLDLLRKLKMLCVRLFICIPLCCRTWPGLDFAVSARLPSGQNCSTHIDEVCVIHPRQVLQRQGKASMYDTDPTFSWQTEEEKQQFAKFGYAAKVHPLLTVHTKPKCSQHVFRYTTLADMSGNYLVNKDILAPGHAHSFGVVDTCFIIFLQFRSRLYLSTE